MIYEFRSRATGNLIMTKPVGDTVLRIIGKPPGGKGIITVAQMPAAIAALEQAVADEKKAQQATRSDDDERAGADANRFVSLGQRAFPFIEMLKTAHRADKDITWGG